jgi:hypothetical protein
LAGTQNKLFFFLFCFKDRVSMWTPGWLRTPHLRASASWVLGLQACTSRIAQNKLVWHLVIGFRKCTPYWAYLNMSVMMHMWWYTVTFLNSRRILCELIGAILSRTSCLFLLLFLEVLVLELRASPIVYFLIFNYEWTKF